MATLVQRMLGEMTVAGDIPPIDGGFAPRHRFTSRRLKPKKRRLISQIMGEAHDEPLIPQDAEKISGIEGSATSSTDDIEQPETTAGDTPQLLDPTLALVAPDVTPRAAMELDPKLVPSRDKTLDLIIHGESKPEVTRPIITEAATQVLPVTPAAVTSLLRAGVGMNESSSNVDAAALPTQDMPLHKAGNPEKMMSAFRRFHK